MKRVGGMYEPILELDNLLVAFHRAARGKSYRAEVREFQDGLPNWLAYIADGLSRGSFAFGRFHQFLIHDPKERIITAPCFEERVVHQRNAPEFSNRANLVRILPPLLQNHPFPLEKRGFRGDSGDSLDDSPGGKAAHETTQHVQAWTCMDVQESQSNWPEMRKTLGKPGV